MQTRPDQTRPERIDWVDAAKGIGILLVIIGHSVSFSPIRGAIFSFHMPLFFICSGITFRFSDSIGVWWTKVCRAFPKTVLLAFGLYTLRTFLACVKNALLGNAVEISIVEMLCTMFYSSGVAVSDRVSAIGAVWFLVALFFCRSIMDCVHLIAAKHCVLIATILCLIGIFVSRIFWLPLSLDIALATGFFFIFGYKYKDMLNKACQEHNNHVLIVNGVIWAITLLLTALIAGEYLEFATRDYPLFPLCYITALSGCTSCFAVMIKIKHIPKLYEIVCYIGRKSMLLYGIHYMTALLGNIGIFRLFVDLSIFGGYIYLRKKDS